MMRGSMPIYEYRCENGHHFDVMQKMTDQPVTTCQECGATLCCDSSPNRHASKHARASDHPVIASAEPGERWLYCYPDESYAEY